MIKLSFLRLWFTLVSSSKSINSVFATWNPRSAFNSSAHSLRTDALVLAGAGVNIVDLFWQRLSNVLGEEPESSTHHSLATLKGGL